MPRDGDLGHLECDVAPVAGDLRAELDQLLLEAPQGPILDQLGRRQMSVYRAANSSIGHHTIRRYFSRCPSVCTVSGLPFRKAYSRTSRITRLSAASDTGFSSDGPGRVRSGAASSSAFVVRTMIGVDCSAGLDRSHLIASRPGTSRS